MNFRGSIILPRQDSCTVAGNFKSRKAKVTSRSRRTASAKFPPDVVRLSGALQSIFVDVVEEVFPAFDLELGVFFVAEALIVVDRHLQLITHGFEFLVQESVGTDAVGFRTDVSGKFE